MALLFVLGAVAEKDSFLPVIGDGDDSSLVVSCLLEVMTPHFSSF
jgi:hypothetical protein